MNTHNGRVMRYQDCKDTADVTISADGVNCDEYSLAKSGNVVECWIALEKAQAISISSHWKMATSVWHIDLIADGILRDSYRTTYMKRQSGSHDFETGITKKGRSLYRGTLRVKGLEPRQRTQPMVEELLTDSLCRRCRNDRPI